jgi:hypothetical protein
MENDLERVCAWCGKKMGTTPSSQTGTTHGICDTCVKKEREAAGIKNLENVGERAEAGKALYGRMGNGTFLHAHGTYVRIRGGAYDRRVGKIEQPNDADGNEYIVRLPDGELKVYPVAEMEGV